MKDVQFATFALLVVITVLELKADVLQPANYTDCTDAESVASINELRLTPCPRVPCDIVKGSSLLVEIDFNLKAPVDNVSTEVSGLIGGTEFRFRGINEDACNDIRLDSKLENRTECPLTDTKHNYTYTTNLRVKESYPTIDLEITWKLRAHKNETLVCFKVPAMVVPDTENLTRTTTL